MSSQSRTQRQPRRARRQSRATPSASQPSEAQFQAAVIELATRCGWLTHHEYDSRRSTAGFPDLVLVRAPRTLFIELKTQRGRVRPEQRAWLETLLCCPGVEVAVWRPADWPTIEATLVHDQRITHDIR